MSHIWQMRPVMTRVSVTQCDRCSRVAGPDDSMDGWLVAHASLVAAERAQVTYHLCGDCRDALGAFMRGEEVSL